MHKWDKEHRRLIREAGRHRNECPTCVRHVLDSRKYLNPSNLLKHLIAAHKYKPKRWWQFWR